MATGGGIFFYNYYNEPLTYFEFFKRNNLLNEKHKDFVYHLKGRGGETIDLQVKYENNQYRLYTIGNFSTDVTFTKMSKDKVIYSRDGRGTTTISEDDIIKSMSLKSKGGSKASVKKEVCGKLRCIYTIAGSRKEHIKYKGQLIAVADYKKLMKKS